MITRSICTKCGNVRYVNFGIMPNTTRCHTCHSVGFGLIKTENIQRPEGVFTEQELTE